jgi:hypothetical protein
MDEKKQVVPAANKTRGPASVVLFTHFFWHLELFVRSSGFSLPEHPHGRGEKHTSLRGCDSPRPPANPESWLNFGIRSANTPFGCAPKPRERPRLFGAAGPRGVWTVKFFLQAPVNFLL